MLEVKNVSYSYNKKQWALKDVSFEFYDKGVVGLLGANGAGKSTLMNLICGILHPTQGTISINDEGITKNRIAYLSNLGFLPQQPPLYTELTVKEYLLHVADFKNIAPKSVKQAVAKAMEKCGITHFQNRLIKNLSGGYQQRVGIAQAIIHSPKIIILDEPTNGLDPRRIIEIRELILDISKDTLILLSTHIISEIEKTCNRILVLEEGKLIVNEKLTDFKKLLPKHEFLVELKEKTAEAISLLNSNSYKVEQISPQQIKVSAKAKTANDILTLLLANDFAIESIRPEYTTIEEAYHFISRKTN